MGLLVWNEDEAGPYPCKPYPGQSWQSFGRAVRYPHEYVRNGTAKLLTLFHPASGQILAKGVRRCTHAILHPWLQSALSTALEPAAPLSPVSDSPERRRQWLQWQEGLKMKSKRHINRRPLTAVTYGFWMFHGSSASRSSTVSA